MTGRCGCSPTRAASTPDALTKSGIILGMGEEWDEVIECMRDLRRSDVNILTLGQYLRPSDGHLPVVRYYTPDEFAELRDIGMRLGLHARAGEPADAVVVPCVGADRQGGGEQAAGSQGGKAAGGRLEDH